jgi:hypothetical protein
MTNVQEANYIHALLHRREGERVGELSLRGWSNSCYWNDQTGSHPIQQQLQQKALETTAGKTCLEKLSCALHHTSRATMSSLAAAACLLVKQLAHSLSFWLSVRVDTESANKCSTDKHYTLQLLHQLVHSQICQQCGSTCGATARTLQLSSGVLTTL